MGTQLKVSGVTKSFNRRTIFSNITFTLVEKGSLAITGPNGSGKSTLLKVIASLLTPTNGSIIFSEDAKNVGQDDLFSKIGFVAPYIQLYDEFTGIENLQCFADIRGITTDDSVLDTLLERLRLLHRRNDLVRTYSSGMKQRLKYAFALLHRPPILILDEPTANLDPDGRRTVESIIIEQKNSGILIIATNEEEELRYCDQFLDLSLHREKAGSQI